MLVYIKKGTVVLFQAKTEIKREINKTLTVGLKTGNKTAYQWRHFNDSSSRLSHASSWD